MRRCRQSGSYWKTVVSPLSAFRIPVMRLSIAVRRSTTSPWFTTTQIGWPKGLSMSFPTAEGVAVSLISVSLFWCIPSCQRILSPVVTNRGNFIHLSGWITLLAEVVRRISMESRCLFALLPTRVRKPIRRARLSTLHSYLTLCDCYTVLKGSTLWAKPTVNDCWHSWTLRNQKRGSPGQLRKL